MKIPGKKTPVKHSGRVESPVSKATDQLPRGFSGQIFNALSEAILIYDAASNRILYVNRGATALYGFSKKEMLEMSLEKLCRHHSGEDLASFRNHLVFAREGKSQRFEWLACNKKGQPIWVEINVHSMNHGNRDIIVLVARDINERKLSEAGRLQNEQKLENARKTLELVINNIPQRIFWKDLNLNYLGCNRWFALDAGLSSSKEIYGKNDFELGWANEAEIYRADDANVIKTGKPKLGYEEPQTTPDGDTIWLRTNKIPVTNEEGNITGVLGTYENITREKVMAEELKKSEEQLIMAMEAARMNTFYVNLDEDRVSVSGSFFDELGYNEIDRPRSMDGYYSFIHPNDQAPLNKALEMHLKGESQRFYCEFRFRNAENAWRWYAISGKEIKSGNQSQIRTLVGLSTDITAKKEAEQTLLRINEELEKRVNERTAELTESYRELESFSFSVSHDLRAPLRHIDSFATMLEDQASESLNEINRKYLENILQSSRRMGRLIDDLLNFSRLGRAELNKITFDLDLLVKEVIEEFSLETRDRRIVWNIQTMGEVTADPNLLRLAMNNLISNALKYSTPREPAIIELGKTEEKNRKVYFVRDNGVGFNMKYAGRVFDVFQRLHHTEEFEGTGIGLANVKKIINRHKGKVWVEAKEGEGACFYFTLPGG